MARARANTNGRGGRPNKRQAVRDAMEVLGMDAHPEVIHTHIKEKTGLDISTNMISSYKSQIRSKAGLKSKRRRRHSKSDKAASSGLRTGDGISLKDLRTLKEMADRLGVHRLKDLFEILYQ